MVVVVVVEVNSEEVEEEGGEEDGHRQRVGIRRVRLVLVVVESPHNREGERGPFASVGKHTVRTRCTDAQKVISSSFFRRGAKQVG